MMPAQKLTHGSGSRTDAVCKAAANANVRLQSLSTTLRFAVQTTGSKASVKLVNSTTREVVKDVTSDEILAIDRSLERMRRVLEKMA